MIENYFVRLASYFIVLLALTSFAFGKSFYSINSGVWSDKANWSEIGYTGAEASSFPFGKDTIYIGDDHTITLDRNLDLFDGGILIIDYGHLEFYSGTLTTYSNKGSYVQIGEFGGLLNAGNHAGWIIGELRLYVGDGTAKRDLFFEVGTLMIYSPFGISFSKGTEAVAGYISLELISGVQHEIQTPISLDMSRLIGPKFWRLMQPEGSAFVRGHRNFDIKLLANSENELAYVDSWACCEMGFLRSWTNNFDWQALWPDTTGSIQSGMGCEDSRALIRPIPNFAYFGSDNYEKSLVTLGVLNISDTIPFGSTEKIGNNVLLGDFIAGNENLLAASVNIDDQSKTKITPISSNGIVTFDITNTDVNSISIYNSSGESIAIDRNLIKMSENHLSFDVNSLPNGVYFLKTDNSTIKFIVIR